MVNWLELLGDIFLIGKWTLVILNVIGCGVIIIASFAAFMDWSPPA